jgi:hypothetical protein
MSDPNWYEVTDGPLLYQGDILKDCPIFVVEGPLSWPLPVDIDLNIGSPKSWRGQMLSGLRWVAVTTW